MSTIALDNFFRTFRISAAGLSAEKKQLAVTAENIANATTTRTLDGTAYRRKTVVREMISRRHNFAHDLRNASLALVRDNSHHIGESNYEPDLVNRIGSRDVKSTIEEQNQFKRVLDPNHPDADKEGYVNYPDINVVSEMLNLISASRGYEANVTVMNAAKSMAKKALEI